MRRILVAALLLCPTSGAAGAQEQPAERRPRARAVRTDVPPRIDGRLDDEVWKLALPLEELVGVEPAEGARPSERTEVRILYDDDFLYVGVRCFDREPERIIATQMERDAVLDPDDRVEIVLDTFLDRRNAYFFQMNAAGSRGDALVVDNGRDFNKSWDGIWDGRAVIDAQGWSFEWALPFKTLNFRPGLETWGLNVNRYIKRREELARWAGARRNYGIFRLAEAGDLEGLTGVRQGIGLDFKPFFVAGWSNERGADDQDLRGRPGFDALYRLTPNLNLLLTANTDFAETEADQRRPNLTRFELFFPERRDFFLQDAGLFVFADLGSGSGLIPFFSRRIGLDPRDGSEIPLEWGVKLTGRQAGWNVGLLDVRTGASGELAAQNLFVGRVARNIGEQSTVGALVTAGDPLGGKGLLAGLDLNLRTTSFLGDQNLQASVWALASDGEREGDAPSERGEQQALGASLSYPNELWSWRLAAREIGRDFRAPLGFVPRPGVRDYAGQLVFRPRPAESAIRRWLLELDLRLATDGANDPLTEEVELQPFGIEWDSGDVLTLETIATRELLDQDFALRPDLGLTIPAGRYEWTRAELELSSSLRRPLSVDLLLGTGGFFDGTRDELGLDLAWRASRYCNLGLGWIQNRVRLPAGSFTSRVALTRLKLVFTPDLDLATLAQWDDESDTIGLQSRLRWILAPGRDLYLVFNQLAERTEGGFAPAFQEARVKLEYTFRF